VGQQQRIYIERQNALIARNDVLKRANRRMMIRIGKADLPIPIKMAYNRFPDDVSDVPWRSAHQKSATKRYMPMIDPALNGDVKYEEFLHMEFIKYNASYLKMCPLSKGQYSTLKREIRLRILWNAQLRDVISHRREEVIC